MLAGRAEDSADVRAYFENERHVLAIGTAFGELRVVATYSLGLVYVRGENFDIEFYGSGVSLSAALRDYLESVEAFVAGEAAKRPQRD